MEEAEIILCTCSSAEHQIIVRYDLSDKDDPELYCDIHLAPLPFWDRLKHGIKYIFGYKCRYGAFDEMIFDKRHAEKFLKIGKFLNNGK